ncbi:MAG TPA: carboxypeptidase-like regulatory domain-containing protein, partial [Terriglobales bacterium]
MKRYFGILCVVLVALAGWAFPQATNVGTVTGQVTDAQGAAMVGATVLLTNNATNAAQATIANQSGRYVFSNVQPGTYTLTVKKQGFKDAVVKNQEVSVNKQLTLNVPMQVGVATQTVEVTASGAELQTMNSTVGSSVTGDAIVKLPNLGRDANALTTLQPNTAPDGGIAGADRDQNSYTLDGGSNSDDMDGSHSSYTPSSGNIGTGSGGNPSGVIPTPADSIEQFSVGVDNQTASFNGSAGSAVNMVTKRGTDAVHGSAYEYYLGSALGANTWVNNRTNTRRPISHQNRFGASLGGQILPSFLGGKTYLFGLYEGRRYPLTTVVTRAVPGALMRAGVIEANNQGGGGFTPYNLNPTSVTVNGTTYAPASCTQPGGGAGPCDPRGLGLNPVVAQLWKQFVPLPNNLSVGGDHHNTFGYTTNVPTPLRSNFAVARVDHDFGAKNHFSVSYHFYSFNPITTSQIDIGGAIPGHTFGQGVATTARPELPSMWTADLTTGLTPNLTNDLHYSYLRNFWQWGGADLNPQPLTGFAGLGGALEIGGETSNALIPYNVNTQSVRSRFWDGIGNTFRDDVTLLHGNHIFQFGGIYTYQWDYHQRNDNGGGIMAAN